MPFLSRKKHFKSPLKAKNKFELLLENTKSSNKNANKESSSNREVFINHKQKSTSQSEDKPSDLSFRMNEPIIKDAYANFLHKFDQLPGSKITNEVCSTPNNDGSIVLSIEDKLKEIEHEKSNLSLSQEVLNQKEVKNAYVKHCKDVLNNQEYDFMKHFKFIKNKLNKTNVADKKQNKNNLRKESKKKVNKVSIEELEKKVKSIIEEEKELLLKEKSFYERMTLVQESRNVGLYVLCDKCNKARYLLDVKDPLDLPEKWYCYMNPDGKHSSCSDPEGVLEDEDFLINNLYNAGSIVWARVAGYPWWPALVEDDPDLEQYFWLEENCESPTYYHVTFFDSKEVTRAWLCPQAIKPFKVNMKNPLYQTKKTSKYYRRLKVAIRQAEDAVQLPLIERLKNYSFITRYTKPIKKRNYQEDELYKENSEKLEIKETNKAYKKKKYNKDSKKKLRKTRNAKNSPEKKAQRFEKEECKKFKRICTISSISDSNDNLSILLEDLDLQDPENFDFNLL